MPVRLLSAAAVAAALILSVSLAHAHGGEDHGAPPTPAAPPAVAAGFGAEGAAFQVVLVPVPTAGTTTVLVADADTNAPVSGAAIEVEAGGWQGTAAAAGAAGVYSLPWLPPAGGADATVMIGADGRDDLLLVTGLHLPETASAASGSAVAHWTHWAGGGALGLGAAALVALLRRRRKAALSAALAVLLATPAAWAHGGEDHGAAAAPPAAEPGAVLTMPKATQFLLGIRTSRIETREAADTVRVVGRVIPDPAGYARVQPSQPARVVYDPAHPIPVPGQAVRRGQVLAVLEPTLTMLERGDKRAALSRVDGDIALAERDLARQTALGGVVPAKQVETTRIRLEQLRQERGQITGTALGREMLTAPVDGVVTDVHVVPGEVVATDRALVEIVDLALLRVEAVVHDVALAGRISGATATTRLLPDRTFALSPLGVSPRVDPVDMGVHAVFAVAPDQAPLLRVGMPVDVHLSTGATRLQTAVPRDAIAESGGRQVVFVRTGPETFEARPVVVHRVLGPLAEVHGVTAGERVVTQGVEQMKAVR